MINLAPNYADELYDKACNRTVKLGAESLHDTIALLEHESDKYRKKIDELQDECAKLNHDKDMMAYIMNSQYGMYGDAGKTVITINRKDVTSVDVYFKEN